MAQKPNEDDSIRRRGFLKSATAVAGISVASLETAMAKSTPDGGRSRFVEIGIEYDVSDSTAYPIEHHDDMVRYAIDQSEHRLYLGSFVGEEAVQAFGREGWVLKGGGGDYRTFTSRTGLTDQGSLTTELGRNDNVTRSLQVKGTVEQPTVTLEPRREDVSVAVESRHERVGPGEERSISLSVRTVEVPAAGAYHEIPDPRSGGTKKTRAVETRNVTVTPRVFVRNRGELEVFDASDDGLSP
jgi:hypothetical protein